MGFITIFHHHFGELFVVFFQAPNSRKSKKREAWRAIFVGGAWAFSSRWGALFVLLDRDFGDLSFSDHWKPLGIWKL